MKLEADGREYAHWDLDNVPDDIDEAEIRLWSEDWISDWISVPIEAGTPKFVKLLVAGPDADAGTAVVLPQGKVFSKVRLSDNPELVIRTETDPIYVGV